MDNILTLQRLDRSSPEDNVKTSCPKGEAKVLKNQWPPFKLMEKWAAPLLHQAGTQTQVASSILCSRDPRQRILIRQVVFTFQLHNFST